MPQTISCQTAFFFAVLTSWSLTANVSTTLVKPRVYQVQSVNSTCTSEEFKIRLELNRKFHGVVYAKGFPLEKSCSAYGTGESFVDVAVDTSGCGVRMISSNDKMFTYRILLNVQMDKYLQQITDLEVTATCNLPLNEMHFKSVLTPAYARQISRTGRNKASEETEEINGDGLGDIKSWMEIEGTSLSSNVNKVFVGEQTMMLVKSILPAENVDASVVDCYAYDGTTDVIQKLLDDNGCPLDETIMPSLKPIKYESGDATGDESVENDESDHRILVSKKKKIREGYEKLALKKRKEDETGGDSSGDPDESAETKKMRLRVMGTTFSAFKFPDTSNLHLRCSLQLCKNACPPVSCEGNAETSHIRLGKSVKSDKSDRNSSTVIEKIEVFNSVEVLAPGIDADEFTTNQDGPDAAVTFEENSFCLSTSKMAVAFAILGAVFLCGVLAVLWTVMRNQMRKVQKLDGSEQVLVVRDSPLNFRNVRNKLYYNWSYS